MLVNSPKIFYKHAFDNHYAFPAFNAWNLEIAKAVAEAADLENAPNISADVLRRSRLRRH